MDVEWAQWIMGLSILNKFLKNFKKKAWPVREKPDGLSGSVV